MIWNLYCLAKWPAAQARIHSEVESVVGTRALQLEDLKNLPLVKASLKETLRLYPAPFVISRIMQSDTNVRGYNVPAGVRGPQLLQLNAHKWMGIGLFFYLIYQWVFD